MRSPACEIDWQSNTTRSTGGFDVALDIAAVGAVASFWRLGDFRPDKMARITG
jgi:hypothetical protein